MQADAWPAVSSASRNRDARTIGSRFAADVKQDERDEADDVKRDPTSGAEWLGQCARPCAGGIGFGENDARSKSHIASWRWRMPVTG